MKKFEYIRISIISTVAIALHSCIFPYEAEIQSSDENRLVVIEGDIIPGDETYVSLGFVFPLDSEDVEMFETPNATAWVEDEQGVIYNSTSSFRSQGQLHLKLDTRTAPSDRKYRLCARFNDLKKNYYTEWLEPNPAPVLDSLSYLVGDEDVQIRLSAHSDEGGQYFRWSYDELWKYHAEYAPQYAFSLTTGEEVPLLVPDYSLYWCWSNHSSTEIELCATTDLNSNAMVNHGFLDIPRSNPRLMTRYRITVSVRSISAAAYRFLHTLQINSDFVGSLFSPNPSDVRGNIYCEENPEEYVIGFIDCCAPSVGQTIYINSSGIYRKPSPRSYPFVPELIYDEDGQLEYGLNDYWRDGYSPVMDGKDRNGKTGVLWDLRRCVDCRLDGGGVLRKPEDWEE